MKNKLFIVLAFASIFLITSCSKNSCTSTSVADATAKVTAAATAYSSDPTNVTKCKAYKTAYEDYINEVDGCSLVDQTSIDAAKASLATLTCD